MEGLTTLLSTTSRLTCLDLSSGWFGYSSKVTNATAFSICSALKSARGTAGSVLLRRLDLGNTAVSRDALFEFSRVLHELDELTLGSTGFSDCELQVLPSGFFPRLSTVECETTPMLLNTVLGMFSNARCLCVKTASPTHRGFKAPLDESSPVHAEIKQQFTKLRKLSLRGFRFDAMSFTQCDLPNHRCEILLSCSSLQFTTTRDSPWCKDPCSHKEESDMLCQIVNAIPQTVLLEYKYAKSMFTANVEKLCVSEEGNVTVLPNPRVEKLPRGVCTFVILSIVRNTWSVHMQTRWRHCLHRMWHPR